MGIHIDSERAISPTRTPAMMRRERREAIRRMVLLSLLVCVIFLTRVAFRQPNSFMSDYSQHSVNSTSSTYSNLDNKTTSWFNGRPKSSTPTLSNSGRHLSDSSLADLKNLSLGVRYLHRSRWDGVTDNIVLHSSKMFSSSTCLLEPTNLTP